MGGMNVPQLRRKLSLLVQYGHYESMNALAAAMNRSPITLKGWANGGSGTPAETVPQRNISALINAFARALPDLADDHIRRLLEGPADDLESFLQTSPKDGLKDLIASEADMASARIFLDESGALSLVRRARRVPPAPRYRVQLGQAFRIEVPTKSRAGFVLGLQAAPGGWGVVPATLEREAGLIHLPGPEELEGAHATLSYLVEENEIGSHLFIAAQSPKPFPDELLRAGRDGIPLDRTLLTRFQQHFEAQSRKYRRLFAVEIAFEREPEV